MTENISSFLTFTLSPELPMMLPTQKLSEIINLEPTKIVPIPEMPPTVVGVFPWQGEILWLIDLAYLVGLSPVLKTELTLTSYRVLKIKTEGNSFGFLVEQCGKVITYQPQQIQAISHPSAHPILNRCLQGAYLNSQGETVWILDVEAIIPMINQQKLADSRN